LAAVRGKFARLRQLRAELEAIRTKYAEHDALVRELLPLFITTDADGFRVNKRVTIGSEVHTLVPYFFDERKGILVVKQWKSTACPTFTIE